MRGVVGFATARTGDRGGVAAYEDCDKRDGCDVLFTGRGADVEPLLMEAAAAAATAPAAGPTLAELAVLTELLELDSRCKRAWRSLELLRRGRSSRAREAIGVVGDCGLGDSGRLGIFDDRTDDDPSPE